MPLTLTALSGIPILKPGDNLGDLIFEALTKNGVKPENGDILVLAQKIVSKAEGRFADLSQIKPSKKAEELAAVALKDPRFVELVLQESKAILRVRPGVIIAEHRNGFICANAGIDHSNVQSLGGQPENWVLLLPQNADESARKLRVDLEKRYGVRLGVLIIDSHGRAWRMGTIGMTIGLSGFPALVDLRGEEDLFGYKLQVSQVAAADELAAGASLMMGQAGEAVPVVHVRGFPYPMREASLEELIRPREQDMFR